MREQASELSQARAGVEKLRNLGTDWNLAYGFSYESKGRNEVNSTYNIVPLHGSVHQTSLHRVVPGLEAPTRPVDIPLPTSEPSRQKRTLTPCPSPVRHDALGMRPQRYAQSRERVVFTPGPDGQPVTLLLAICAKTNSLVYIGRFNHTHFSRARGRGV